MGMTVHAVDKNLLVSRIHRGYAVPIDTLRRCSRQYSGTDGSRSAFRIAAAMVGASHNVFTSFLCTSDQKRRACCAPKRPPRTTLPPAMNGHRSVLRKPLSVLRKAKAMYPITTHDRKYGKKSAD